MDRLPDVPLLLIFGFINDPREMIKLERVCKRWQKTMLRDGWKHVRHIKLYDARGIEPIGVRCGAHMVEFSCSFFRTDINSIMIRLIATKFPVLKSLDFSGGQLNELDESALASFRQLGTHLRALTFFAMPNSHQLTRHFSDHFTGLRHLGLYISGQEELDFISFSDNLRSLYFDRIAELGLIEFSSCMERLVQRDLLRGLGALYMGNYYMGQGPQQQAQFLERISELKIFANRYLRIFFHHYADSELLCSCLNNLTKLHALNVNLTIQQLSDVLRSHAFRALVHLSLPLAIYPIDNYEPIGLLFKFAPQLRSLNLDLMCYYRGPSFVFEMLKMPQNDTLEFLNVSVAWFTAGELDQIVRHCPNLHFFGAQLRDNEPPDQLAELRHVVADQWRAGKRKRLPLKIWLYIAGYDSDICWQDAFLTIHMMPMGIEPPNPVLNELFRDEVFNDDGDGGTPSIVTSVFA